MAVMKHCWWRQPCSAIITRAYGSCVNPVVWLMQDLSNSAVHYSYHLRRLLCNWVDRGPATVGLDHVLRVLVARLDVHLSRDGYGWDVLEPQSFRPLCLRSRLEALDRSLIYVVVDKVGGEPWAAVHVCVCENNVCFFRSRY